MILFIVMGCSNKEYKEALEKGEKAIDNKSYGEAVTFFEKAVDENEEDERANSYLKQAENMTAGMEAFEKGDLNHAKKDFNVILNENDDHAILHKQAKEQLQRLHKMETTYDEVSSSYEEAEDYFDEEKYQKSLALIDESLEKDLDHNYYNKLEDDLQHLKKKVKDKQKELEKLQDEAEETYNEANSLASNDNYNEALSIVNKTLEKDLSHRTLTSIKKDLGSLQVELQEKEKQGQAEKIKNQLFGYWYNIEHEIEVCHFQADHYICFIAASDGADFGYVQSYEVDDDTGMITITKENGESSNVSVEGDILHIGSSQYRKGTKEEIYGKIEDFVENPAELFKMEFYKDWVDL